MLTELSDLYGSLKEENYLVIIAFVIVSIMFTKIVKIFMSNILVKIVSKITKQKISNKDAKYVGLQRVSSFVSIVIAMSIASMLLPLDEKIIETVAVTKKAIIIFTMFYSVAHVLLPLLFDKIFKNVESNSAKSQKDFILTILKVVLIVLGLLSALQSFGINVSAFLAGLTITSTAIAFGAQDMIKNFFGSLAIMFDETFQPGDWIKSPDVEGVVERVGLRTTLVRQFDKALVAVPNDKLANSALTNYNRMTQRRILWNLGIVCETSNDQVERILTKLREYLENNNDIETDASKTTTLINADQFNDSSLNIFCYFFTKTTNWKEYMNIKEKCLMDFRKIIEEEGSSMAYPVMEMINRDD